MLPSESTLISIVCDRSPCVRNPTFCLENLADDVRKPKNLTWREITDIINILNRCEFPY